MLDEQRKVAEVRKYLDQIYNHDGASHAERVDLSQFSDEELLALARNLTDGVPMATPVFGGATEAEIKRMLELAEYKRRQACPGVKISRKAFGRDRRYPIVNKFTDLAVG